MLTIQEVNSAIITGTFTNDQLSSMIDAIKYARAQLTRQKTRAFVIGDKVKFTSNRNGLTYVGTVNKIKIKFIIVSTPGGLFNVPANMLESA